MSQGDEQARGSRLRALTAGAVSLLVAAPVLAQSKEVAAPAEQEAPDAIRIFLDTQVLDVTVDDSMTVATLAASPESPCSSEPETYIYSRERPKWLQQTGRLMQAQEEGATIRISFSCVNGRQSINAIQFLSPPPSEMAQTMPRREDSVEARARTLGDTPQAPAEMVPLPTKTPARVPSDREELVRSIPAPE